MQRSYMRRAFREKRRVKSSGFWAWALLGNCGSGSQVQGLRLWDILIKDGGLQVSQVDCLYGAVCGLTIQGVEAANFGVYGLFKTLMGTPNREPKEDKVDSKNMLRNIPVRVHVVHIIFLLYYGLSLFGVPIQVLSVLGLARDFGTRVHPF